MRNLLRHDRKKFKFQTDPDSPEEPVSNRPIEVG